jgi:SAM-dependent methyltransferase
MSALPSVDCVVPPEIFARVRDGFAAYFEGINGIDRELLARDHLDPGKSHRRAEILRRFTPLRGKKVLEVGSGCGTNLVVWTRAFGADVWGVEPDGVGFESSLPISRQLLEANGLDPDRVKDAEGEALPFRDESFDVVYSANVLEHTRDPHAVLAESVRVLRPGGLLHFEMPNFLSYFEGHYAVPQPPILWPRLLEIWVSVVYRRDASFARTLRREINPVWCRRAVRRLQRRFPLRLLSLGEEIFLERLRAPFRFETQNVKSRLEGAVALFQAINVANWLGRVVVGLQGFYPIYMTLARLPDAGETP